MRPRHLLVTGASGLIGSEIVAYFAVRGWTVHGLDNNMRAEFFGSSGDTRWNLDRLTQTFSRFVHHEVDVRNRTAVLALIKEVRPTTIVHTAAQPSHDLAMRGLSAAKRRRGARLHRVRWGASRRNGS